MLFDVLDSMLFDIFITMLLVELIQFDLISFHLICVDLMLFDSVYCDSLYVIQFQVVWLDSMWFLLIRVHSHWFNAIAFDVYLCWSDSFRVNSLWCDSVWFGMIWFGFIKVGSIGCGSICLYLVGFTCRVSLAWASDCFRVPGLTLFSEVPKRRRQLPPATQLWGL